ncbi:hypothetical protein EXV95_02815 [Acidovorax sp. JMULE5]|uniref:clostripain-related cysteine peptidase n=1 Tax=Acidovorax sp. JMULE5 TaxID=2518343 RepID=UPI0015A19E4F|nr:hypothetical protein EXV95_02815 [Acidovorax sp. JMULE5]
MHNLSRRHMLGTAAALLAGGLAACGGSGPDSSAPLSTTLLVYLLGSDLESKGNAGTSNLLEMLAAKGSTHTRIVITTGGGDKVDPAGLVTSWKTVKRFELVDGKLKELSDLGPQNMVWGSTLQDFVTWGVRTYPADRTMLILWNHGSGYFGFGSDENFPDGESMMRMHTMAAALQAAKVATGVTLDYIGFDACLMATLEIAKTLQPYARYLGASQELEPGSGWDWTTVAETASRQPALSVPEFGQATANAFYEKQMRSSPGGSLVSSLSDRVTFSIIDLERIPALLERLDQWASAVHAYHDSAPKLAKAGSAGIFWPPMFQPPRQMTKAARTAPVAAAAAVDDTVERWKQVAMARLSTLAFGESPSTKDALDLVDLGQFAALLRDQGIAADPQAALQQALQDAVLFNITGPMARSATGLSIFFPLGKRTAQHRALYDTFGMPAGFMGLVDRHTQQAQQMPSVIYVEPLQATGEFITGQIASRYGVQLADLMQVQPVGANVVKVTGTTPIVSGESELGKGYGTVYYSTDAWLQLDGQPLLLYTLSRQTDEDGDLQSAMLGAPVRLQSRTGDSAARIVLLLIQCEPDPDTEELKGTIIGARDIDLDDPDEQPDRVDHHLYAGDTVEPLHLLYDVQTQEPVQEPGGGLAITFGKPITLAPDSALHPEPLAAGTHTLILSVTDLADGVGFSPPLTVTMS